MQISADTLWKKGIIYQVELSHFTVAAYFNLFFSISLGVVLQSRTFAELVVNDQADLQSVLQGFGCWVPEIQSLTPVDELWLFFSGKKKKKSLLFVFAVLEYIQGSLFSFLQAKIS